MGTRDGFSVLPETRRAVVLFIVPQLIAPCCCCDRGKGHLLMALTSAIVVNPTPQTKTTNPKPFGLFMPGDHVSDSTLTYSFKLNKGRILSCTTIAGFRLGAVEKAAVAPATCSFKNSAFFALMISKCSMLSSALCTALSFFLSCAVFAVGGCWVVLVGVGLLLVGLEPLGLKL